MVNVCGIYKITSPTKSIYVGQSVNVVKRINYYKTLNCRGQKKLYASFLKYGYDNHKFEILEECERDRLNELEVYYINLFQSFNTLKGMNLSAGGDSFELSDEAKERKSKALKGRVFTQEWKDKIGAKSKGRMLGYKPTEETLKKLRVPRGKSKYPHPKKGKGMSLEQRKINRKITTAKYRLKIKELNKYKNLCKQS